MGKSTPTYAAQRSLSRPDATGRERLLPLSSASRAVRSSARIALCFVSLLLIFLSASAQQPAPKTPPAPPQNAPGSNATAGGGGVATFSTATQLVVEEVTVLDKSGKPVDGLTKKDFTITEDGVAQDIEFFDNEQLPEVSGPQLQNRPETPLVVEPLEKLTRTEIAPEAPGDVQLHNRRLLCLYFDMTSMQQADQLRALSSAEKFVRTQMAPEDIMAIMQYAGAAVEVLTDFTDNKEKLLSIIETIIVGEGQGFGETATDAGAADNGAAFGQDDSEFNIFTTDRQLAALQTAAKMLGGRNEKKALIVFASGLQLNGIDNQAQLHATENAALRAGVQFWPIDARGLVATPAMGDLSQRTAGGTGILTGATAMAYSTRLAQSQDTLWTLASDTGGKALLDNNDLGKGIENAEKAMSSYYIIGYYSKNSNLDGKFRKIKITVAGDNIGKLDYRQGYYGNKTFNKFTTADKERQLEDALMAGDPITELTIAVELDFFQINRAEYFVNMMVKIPGRELALAKQKFGAEHTVIDFIGEVKDDFGSTEQNIRDKVDIKLSDATAAELAKKPIEYNTVFTLLPGKKTIKILARDAETGRIGTYMQTYIIPNLMKEEKRIPISSVVLSSQRVDLKDALFNALKDKDKAETTNPLVIDGQKLIPSVTRVFSKTRDMYVYLQAYEQTAETLRPVVAFVTFYKGQTKAFETAPIQVGTTTNPRLKTMPLRFTVPLASLEPGQYDCQVTVLDPEGQKTAFWQDKVQIVQ
jgi:VWFA-related protein